MMFVILPLYPNCNVVSPFYLANDDNLDHNDNLNKFKA